MPSNTPYGLHEYAGTDIAATTLEDTTNAAALDAAAGHVGQQNTRTSSEVVLYSSNTVSPTSTGGNYASSGPAAQIQLTAAGVVTLVATPSGSSGAAYTTTPLMTISPTNLTTTPSSVLTVGTVIASNFVGIPTQAITPTTTVLTSGAGTYVTPAGCRLLWVRALGGGGGGGGSVAEGSTAFSATGGGGGAGGYVDAWIASPAASYVYSVGTGGSGGVVAVSNGGSGGNTTFGSPNIIFAGGGSGGATINVGGNGGGLGGSATLNGIGLALAGAGGNGGSNAVSVGGTQVIGAPSGGGSPFGGAGAGAPNGVSIVNGGPGQANTGGGGGGGTVLSASNTAGNGGAGGSGVIFIVAF